MKPISVIRTMIVFTSSCNLVSSNEATSTFIPGIYVREISNEYSIGRDTLAISHFNASTYAIVHYSTYQRIEEGQLLPKERKVEKWVALYDKKAALLKEGKRGRLLSFQPQNNRLLVGSSPYQKVK